MSKEWGRDPDNDPDFTGLIWSALFLVSLLLIATAALQGCAPRYEYKDVKITTCSQHKLGCGK